MNASRRPQQTATASLRDRRRPRLRPARQGRRPREAQIGRILRSSAAEDPKRSLRRQIRETGPPELSTSPSAQARIGSSGLAAFRPWRPAARPVVSHEPRSGVARLAGIRFGGSVRVCADRARSARGRAAPDVCARPDPGLPRRLPFAPARAPGPQGRRPADAAPMRNPGRRRGASGGHRPSASASACMSAGSGASKRRGSPVTGWSKPSVAACRAWRGKPASASPAASPNSPGALRERPP